MRDLRTRTTVTGEERDFMPGMAREWLLLLYDPMTRLYGIDRVHRRLLEQTALSPGQRVLEIGCGTGTLLLAAKRAQPAAVVVGLDPDLAALARAHRKARGRGLAAQFDRGYADALPYPDDSVDVVLSSFMFHHLPDDQRQPALREVVRVLRPGGALHLVDVGGGENPGHGRIRHRRHAHEHAGPEAVHGIPEMLERAGFADVVQTGSDVHRRVGQYTFFRAST